MALLTLTPKLHLLLFLLPLLCNHAIALLTAPTYVYHDCQNYNYDFFTDNSTVYPASVTTLLLDLANKSSTASFHNSSSGVEPYKAYGQFYCTGNVDSEECNSCVRIGVAKLSTNCSTNYKGAVIMYQECTLRYSNASLYGVEDQSLVAWYYSTTPVSFSQFNQTVSSTMNGLITQAANSTSLYASGDASLEGTTRRLYALAQCSPDVVGSDCVKCLEYALQNTLSCCGTSTFVGVERRVLMTFLPSCQMRFEVAYPTFAPSLDASSSEFSGRNAWQVMFAMVAAVVMHIALVSQP